MTHENERPPRKADVPVQLRMQKHVREVIDRAAELLGKNRTAFMTDAAFREAQDILMHQTEFRLDDEAWARFIAILDAPPRDNPRLRELLAHKAPWEG